MMRIFLATCLLTTSLAAVAATQAPAGSGAWLDDINREGWNRPGGKVPSAPAMDGESLTSGRCAEQVRRPSGEAIDLALVAAGWSLVGPLQVFGTTALATAAASADGMCRPLGYQAFLFVDGKFAGTLSPSPMNSRSDGMMSAVRLTGPASLVAEFLRYAPGDPLCCASRTVTLAFAVEPDAAGPVLVPTTKFLPETGPQ